MIWDSNAPLELLAHMPVRLTGDNLELIQATIDRDKYICSCAMHRDLCGEYAPFCSMCDKSVIYPCAVAYIKMKNAEDLSLEVAVADSTPDTESKDVDRPEETTGDIEHSENIPYEIIVEEEPVEEELTIIREPTDGDTLKKKSGKRIRVAVARRKH